MPSDRSPSGHLKSFWTSEDVKKEKILKVNEFDEEEQKLIERRFGKRETIKLLSLNAIFPKIFKNWAERKLEQQKSKK